MDRELREKLEGGRFQNVASADSRRMAAVRGKGNKTTEVRLRLALVRASVRGWKVHARGVQGHPDFFFPVQKVAVFVDGCFWHGCAGCGHVPRKNGKFWQAKIQRNRERDSTTTRFLGEQGITVLRFWEHELNDDLSGCVDRVNEALGASPIENGVQHVR